MEIIRESIFVSAVRSFCRMFFAILGISLGVFFCTMIYSILSSQSVVEEKTTLHFVPDANGNQALLPPSAPVILELNIQGIIGLEGKESINAKTVENILLDSRNGLLSHDRVKAILLRINTPGGAVIDSDNIYLMLKAYKEKYKTPIFAYVDGLCASGGMYVASSADRIFASPSSVIGSIGVIYGPLFNVSDALKTLGIQALTLTEGLYKDAMNPTRPWKEGEESSYKNLIAFFYQRFVNIVTQARPRLDKNKLIDEYGAQIFDCVKAEQLGYIDQGLASREEALLALLKEAQIDPAYPYQVVTLEPVKNWVAELLQGSSSLLSGKIEHHFEIGQSHLQNQFAYLYKP